MGKTRMMETDQPCPECGWWDDLSAPDNCPECGSRIPLLRYYGEEDDSWLEECQIDP